VLMAVWVQGILWAYGQVDPERMVDQLRGCIWSSDGCRATWQIGSRGKKGLSATVAADSVGVATFDILIDPSTLMNGDGYLDTLMSLLFSDQLERYRSVGFEVNDAQKEMSRIVSIDENGLIICETSCGKNKCQLTACVDTTNSYLINSDIHPISSIRSVKLHGSKKLLSYLRSSTPPNEPRIHGCYLFIEERSGDRSTFQSPPTAV